MTSTDQRSQAQASQRPDDYLRQLSVEQSRLSRRLRWLLITLALSALVLVWLLSILPGRVQSAMSFLGEDRLRQVASDLVLLTNQTVTQHQELIIGIAAQPQTLSLFQAQAEGRLGAEQLQQYNQQLASLIHGMNDELQGVFLCPLSGSSFAGVLQNGDPSPYVALRLTDRDYVRDTFLRRAPQISDPMYSKVSALPVVVLTAPVIDTKGRLIGLVGLSLRIGYLSQIISSKKIGDTGYPFAIDRQGRMVAHPDPQRFFTKVLLEKAKAEDLVQGMLSGKSGVARYRSSQGDEKIAAYAPVASCGWSIAATINLAEYEGPARRLRGILVATLLFVVALGLGVAATLLFGIRRLRHALNEVRSGERKIAEQAALLDQTRDSIVVQDLENRICFWNRGAADIYGWTADEVAGKEHDTLLGVEPRAFREAYAAVLRDGAWQGRLRKRSKSGAPLLLDNRWTLLRTDEGRPYAILSIGTDITERELAEERMHASQRLESLGTLAGGIAHDLNNLLFPIIMGVNILREEITNSEQREILDTLEQSASRGAQLVQQVLAFSRGAKGSLVTVHAGLVVQEIASILTRSFPKNIELKTSVSEDLPLIKADPAQLCQILLNLCINARDAMPSGGRLHVSLSRVLLESAAMEFANELTPGPYLCIQVADSGVGIPRDIQAKIFDPFFSTKGPSRGTGLGLSTVMGIIKSYQGAIHVYSEEGKGTTFKIYLPAVEAGAPPAEDKRPAPEALDGRGRVVLLVDDEEAVRSVGKRLLESRDFVVLTAENGAVAWDLFQKGPEGIDVVVTDIMMPVLDGAALIAKLKGGNQTPPIIAMSGLVDSNLPPLAVAYSIPILSKPILPQELFKLLRTVLKD